MPPRWPKTNPQRTRRVQGVTLTRQGDGSWLFPGGEFVAWYDEGHRAWWVARRREQAGGFVIEEPDLYRTLTAAVRQLRRRGELEVVA